MMSVTSPRIYVASLSDYNSGVLHGAWIDAAQDVDTIREEIAAMLRESKHPNTIDDEGRQTAEEWAIHDYEGFGTWKLSEHESLDALSVYASAVAELDEDDAEAFGAWYGNESRAAYDDAESLLEDFREVYRGKFDSLADYAEQLAEDTGSIPKDLPDFIRHNIDWDGVAHDMQCNGDVWTHDAGYKALHVFENR